MFGLTGAICALAFASAAAGQCFDTVWQSLPVECGPLLAGDFDSDGVQDLLCLQRHPDGTNTLAAFYGRSNSAVSLEGPYPLGGLAGTARETLALGDFDGDGRAEIAAIQWVTVPTLVTFSLEVRGVVRMRSSQVVPDGFRLVSGDFNRDGLDDLAFAVYDPEPRINVFLSQGGGGFALGSSVTMAELPYPIEAVDFDRDGWPDIVAVQQDSSTMLVYCTRSDGSLRPPRIIDRGPFFFTYSFAVADLNGDGVPDFVFGSLLEYSFKVLLSNPDGSYQPRVEYPTPNVHPYQLIAIDWDHDGDTDFVSTNWFVLENRGEGVFARPYRLTPLPDPLIAADFNADGWDDLLCFGPLAIVLTREFTCAADYDCDRFVDFLDLGSFLRAFEEGDIRADFDHDLFLDFLDVEGFLRSFEQGC